MYILLLGTFTCHNRIQAEGAGNTRMFDTFPPCRRISKYLPFNKFILGHIYHMRCIIAEYRLLPSS